MQIDQPWRTGADEIKSNEMNEANVEKWWNEICVRKKLEKPGEILHRLRFVHHEIHVEWPRFELRTLAAEGERLIACATELYLI